MDETTEALLALLAREDRAYLPALLRRLGVRGTRGKRAIQDAFDAAEPHLLAAGWMPRHRTGVRGGYENATWRRRTER
jgi:hypothetical protein